MVFITPCRVLPSSKPDGWEDLLGPERPRKMCKDKEASKRSSQDWVIWQDAPQESFKSESDSESTDGNEWESNENENAKKEQSGPDWSICRDAHQEPLKYESDSERANRNGW